MNAKEYYCKKYDVTLPNIEGLRQIEFAESYYQAKSKKEAEDRHKEAMLFLFGDTCSDFEYSQVSGALRLAAFGKEGEG